MSTHRARILVTRRRPAVPVAALLATVALSGCYERVVDASGPGADTINVQPSERSDTWLDRAVFPEKSKEESAFGSSTADRQRAYLRQNRGGN